MVRSTGIKHSCISAKNLRNYISILERKVDAIDMPNSIDNEIEKKEIKEELDKLNKNKIQGQIIRSHIQCYKYDEKSSQFLCKSAKINYNRKTIVDNSYVQIMGT